MTTPTPEENFSERRKYIRIKKHFILTYFDTHHPESKHDASQLKNISKGGMCFLTMQLYAPGAVLAIELKTPYLTGTTGLEGKVLESHERIKGTLYETRIIFDKLTPQAEFVIDKIVEFYKETSGKQQ